MLPQAYEEHPYKQHPILTTEIIKHAERNNVLGLFKSVVKAGWLFVLSEGVGLTIYFSMSAVMDTFAIFFIKGASVCATVKACSLYTMAVVTFLPNVLIGSWLQKKMYNEGDLPTKALFVVIMAVITVASFVARMWLVYSKGYVSVVDSLLSNTSSHWRVALAVVIPPMVDGIQSMALIMTGSHAKPLLMVILDTQKQVREMHTMLKEQNHQIHQMQDQLNRIAEHLQIPVVMDVPRANEAELRSATRSQPAPPSLDQPDKRETSCWFM
ncbi:unnamed protein product [Prorocentrum cordatum]|uniref:Uncharacterized protein n=1 Tax=Prorocentrum cordatum TaxID=2364126 RepID=A0ABN9WKR1_9DINO|nr:unnamed protein product [Polarella glacialis]